MPPFSTKALIRVNSVGIIYITVAGKVPSESF